MKDITEYTLKELHEAFESINDEKYPDRAKKLYLRIIELEKEINNESQIVETSPSPIFLILKPLIRLLQFCLCLIDSFSIKKISLLKIERIAKQDELEAKLRRIRSLLKNEIK
jgi:hypothetical protein